MLCLGRFCESSAAWAHGATVALPWDIFLPVGSGACSFYSRERVCSQGKCVWTCKLQSCGVSRTLSALLHNSMMRPSAANRYIDEYMPSGSGPGILLQTIAVPQSDDDIAAFSISANDPYAGFMSRVADRSALLVAGYNAPPGTPNVERTFSTVTRRVVAVVWSDGTVDTESVRLEDFSGDGESPGFSEPRGGNSRRLAAFSLLVLPSPVAVQSEVLRATTSTTCGCRASAHTLTATAARCGS